jgi:2C-methyl-D-erythritol 2,4-cyclodiphosphate synthase
VRGGGYTHHAIREGEATILGGVAVDYDFGGL